MDNTQPLKHVCGVCKDEWLTEAEYNNHVCPNTNTTPQDADHLIRTTTPEFASIQQAALERGLEVIQDDPNATLNQQAAIDQITANADNIDIPQVVTIS